MATNITAEFSNTASHGKADTTQKSGISLADVVVNTKPDSSGGWITATVTADLARSHVLTRATHGVPDGTYEKVSAGVFRKAGNV